MSYNAFVTGGGSNFGAELVDRFGENGFNIDVISSKDIDKPFVKNTKLDWNTITYKKLCSSIDSLKSNSTADTYDYVVLNHNSGCRYSQNTYGRMTEDEIQLWNFEFFQSVQTYEIILNQLSDKIDSNTKIISLLSGVIENAESQVTNFFSGYAGNKSYLYFMMKGYSKSLIGTYVMVNPGHMESSEDYKESSYRFYDLLSSLTIESNGLYLRMDGGVINLGV